MKFYGLFFLLLINFSIAQVTQYNTVKEVHTQNKGVVVSAHPIASEVGAKILREGGNAFDAVTATQLALAVVYPQAGNLGGGGFLVAHTKEGKSFTIDFRETAPKKSTPNMYLDKKGNAQTSLSQDGALAVGIPGSVAGFFETQKHGNLPMSKLLEPAIELAEKGFAITKREADLLNRHKEEFKKHSSGPTPFIKDTEWKSGDLLIQKELAYTLREIAKNGENGFYEGDVAKYIVQEIKEGKGILSLEDLKNYNVKLREPLVIPYRNYQVVTMPLPSSGGIILGQLLKFSSMAKLSDYPFLSPNAVQIMIEAERRAYADRAEYMGDPDFIQDQTQKLLSENYLTNRWKTFSFDRASKATEVGTVVTPYNESTETTHISVVDKEGNAVAVTTTLNGLYGSKIWVQGAGIFLNNEMDDFSIKPGVPNMFGAVGGEANKIEPGKRMLSSMTPTIVLANNKPKIVVGTPGGTTIPTSVYQAIVGLLDFNLTPSQAVNETKFHQQWLPESTSLEKGFPYYVREQLEAKGYTFSDVSQIGRTELISIDSEGTIIGVADKRGDDSVGVE